MCLACLCLLLSACARACECVRACVRACVLHLPTRAMTQAHGMSGFMPPVPASGMPFPRDALERLTPPGPPPPGHRLHSAKENEMYLTNNGYGPFLVRKFLGSGSPLPPRPLFYCIPALIRPSALSCGPRLRSPIPLSSLKEGLGQRCLIRRRRRIRARRANVRRPKHDRPAGVARGTAAELRGCGRQTLLNGMGLTVARHCCFAGPA